MGFTYNISSSDNSICYEVVVVDLIIIPMIKWSKPRSRKMKKTDQCYELFICLKIPLTFDTIIVKFLRFCEASLWSWGLNINFTWTIDCYKQFEKGNQQIWCFPSHRLTLFSKSKLNLASNEYAVCCCCCGDFVFICFCAFTLIHSVLENLCFCKYLLWRALSRTSVFVFSCVFVRSIANGLHTNRYFSLHFCWKTELCEQGLNLFYINMSHMNISF